MVRLLLPVGVLSGAALGEPSVSCSSPLPSGSTDWMSCISAGNSYTFASATYYIDEHFRIPDGVTLTGKGQGTVIEATRAVDNGCGSQAEHPGDAYSRIGFILGNNVHVSKLTFKAKDGYRWQGYNGAALCGGAVFETPGCSDAYCQSEEMIADGKGITGASVKDVYITGTSRNTAPQLGVFITQTPSWASPSHDITIDGVTLDHSWADGINIHGSSHDILVQNCNLAYAGDDNLALWSSGASAYNIEFRKNTLSQQQSTNPSKEWGNCIALYGGGSSVKVSDTTCYGTSNGAVKISADFGGSFDGSSSISVQRTNVDGGKPACYFDNVRRSDLNVQGCTQDVGGTAIRSSNSGKCLDLPGGDIRNGRALWQWDCNGQSQQQWVWTDYSIRVAADASYCVDGSSRESGDQLFIWECNGQPQQQLAYDTDAGSISFQNTQTCLDVEAASQDNGAKVQCWECNGYANQHWDLVKTAFEFDALIV